MLIKRFYNLAEYLKPGKVVVIYGARQVGKTTLLRQFLKHARMPYKLDSGDNIQTQDILSSRDFSRILEYVEGYKLLALDEAQYIPNIGLGLKIIVDNRPDIKVIATGSSSFDLANQIGEPLTGRKRTIILFPISQGELLSAYNRYELRNQLEENMIFGSYPEVISSAGHKQKIDILTEIVNSYLLKDILALEKVKSPKILLDLLKLLAFQIGHQVSLNELSTQLSLDVKTIARYLDLLEKSFIIAPLGGLSRNLRREVRSKHKYYFVDNGIRNAVISQFNILSNRNDTGQLWENFIFTERWKKRSYKGLYGSVYYWRTYSGQEIDFIEERDGKFFAFEGKWSEKKDVRPPKEWLEAYPKADFFAITPRNYLDFVT